MRGMTWQSASCRPCERAFNQRHSLSGATLNMLKGMRQGLTLVHFSAQLERIVWDRGCA